MAIHGLLDRALKSTRVHPATIVIERAFGMVMLHSEDKGEVLAAGDAILDALNHSVEDRMKPRLVTNQVIRAIEPDHAQCVNKIRYGSMITPGESLLIIESEPAAYIALAANEAEKAANVQLSRMSELWRIRTSLYVGYRSGNRCSITGGKRRASVDQRNSKITQLNFKRRLFEKRQTK